MAKPLHEFHAPGSRYGDPEGYARSEKRWKEFCAEIDAEDLQRQLKEIL